MVERQEKVSIMLCIVESLFVKSKYISRDSHISHEHRNYRIFFTSVYLPSPVPNWPPLPRWCCFKPCVRIDFNSDIPSECRWMALYGHYFWLAYSCLLLLNIFGTLSLLTTKQPISETGPLFGVSIVVFAVLTPASFFCWNRPLYKALK